jgi:hypothetical protein
MYATASIMHDVDMILWNVPVGHGSPDNRCMDWLVEVVCDVGVGVFRYVGRMFRGAPQGGEPNRTSAQVDFLASCFE